MPAYVVTHFDPADAESVAVLGDDNATSCTTNLYLRQDDAKEHARISSECGRDVWICELRPVAFRRGRKYV